MGENPVGVGVTEQQLPHSLVTGGEEVAGGRNRHRPRLHSGGGEGRAIAAIPLFFLALRAEKGDMFPPPADQKIGEFPTGAEPVGENLTDLFADQLLPAVKHECDSVIPERQKLFGEHAECHDPGYPHALKRGGGRCGFRMAACRDEVEQVAVRLEAALEFLEQFGVVAVGQ